MKQEQRSVLKKNICILMKLHTNVCISGLKHEPEILIIVILTSNMSFSTVSGSKTAVFYLLGTYK